MKAFLRVSIQEWLEPLNSSDRVSGDFRDSVLFGILLQSEFTAEKRLTGFGYGLTHFGRAYVSSTEYFFSNIREKFPGILPKMPNARLQAGISFITTHDFMRSFAEDPEYSSLISRYNEISCQKELSDLKSLVDRDPIYKEVDGLLIAASLFSRSGFHADTKWFEEMVDPVLNYDDVGRGELSYHPDWGKDSADAWCLKFDMQEFRVYLETEIYLQLKMIRLNSETSDYLSRQCDLIMQKLKFANISTNRLSKIPVEIERPYIYDPGDLPRHG